MVRMPENPTATAMFQSLTGFRQRESIDNYSFSATANLFFAVSFIRKPKALILRFYRAAIGYGADLQ